MDDPQGEAKVHDLEKRRRYWRPTKPLPALSQPEAEGVLAHLRNRTIAGFEAYELATAAGERGKPKRTETAEAFAYLELVRALRRAGKITFSEYIMQAGSRLEMVHDDRAMSGAYASELDPVSDAMRAIEREHGLAPGEY